MRPIYLYSALLLTALCSIPCARAQSSFDVEIGGGSFHSSATGLGIDNANSINAFGVCDPNSGDPYCQATPSLGGFFLGFGGNVMLTKRYGAGAEVEFQPNRPNYGPLQSRQTFYSFNGIFAPVTEKRLGIKLFGGIGGARSSFSFNQSGCVGVAVCTQQLLPVGNANHFALDAGVAVDIFVTEHIFVRPEFIYRYVHNFNQVYGSNNVPGGMVWVGYSFGER